MKVEYDLTLTLELALLQAQILILDRSADVLSELGDIKEQRRLCVQSDKLILELSRQQLVPEDPLAFTRKRAIAWLRNARKLIKSATNFLDKQTVFAGDDPKVGYCSLDDLLGIKNRMEQYPAEFGKKLERLRRSCLPDFFATKQQQATIGTIWSHLKHLGLEAAPVDNPREIISSIVLAPGKPDVFTKQLESNIAAHLSAVEQHIGLAKAQATNLSQALDDIKNRGDYQIAETLLRKHCKKRYANPAYGVLKAAVNERNYLYKRINSESSNKVRLEIINTEIKNSEADKWPDSSPLKKFLLDAKEKSLRSAKAKRKKSVLGFMAIVALLVFLIDQEWRAKKELADQVWAEQARLEAEQTRIETEDPTLPPEPKQEEPPPELDTPPPPISLKQLDMALNPGTGGSMTGDFALPSIDVSSSDVSDLKIFELGDVDSPSQQHTRIEFSYPAAAKRRGITGVVKVEYVVNENGRVEQINIVDSPDRSLSEATIDALERARFQPAEKSGRPVKVRMRAAVPYK